MKKLNLVFLLLFAVVSFAYSQRTVTGTLTDEAGEALIGASILAKGTNTGTVTDFNGNYSLEVPEGVTELEVSYTGFATQSIALGASNVLDVTMSEGVDLNEVVVTALGIKREKKSLGYATQEVDGDEVTRVKDANFINSISGKVAGVDIRRSTTIGGSSNVIIRGYTSLTGNNQALFVVDGTPISNDITNTTDQKRGRGGYDFGNAAMDVNPEDIESINILKGAAATALYGSRAANGVVLITTKRGVKKKGLGVTVSSGVTFGSIDKTTMPRYQTSFGPGYGPFYPEGGYLYNYSPGDGIAEELTVPTYEDASFGGALDGSPVYNWDALYPELDSYGQTSPFSAAANDATTFYETATTYNTNVSIDGGTDKSAYRLSFTNFNQSGIVPNTQIKRNTISFGGGYDLTDKLKVRSVVNYVSSEGNGRYGTGYDNRNVNQSFRQWYQVTTDMKAQEEAYLSTGKNITWNPKGPNDPGNSTVPNFFDNYYFNVYENAASDGRSRIFGNIELEYEINDWLNVLGRVSTDRYDEIQEERIAVGSVDVPMYQRFNKNFFENNFDLILSMNKYFGTDDKLSFDALLGTNIRRSGFDDITSSTNGGLVVPGLYSLSNSVSSIEAPVERYERRGVNGYFARANFGYDRFLYLDLTGRYDISSTLPADNNAYFYPSASLSLVFSELMTNTGAFDFGKLRLNYAEVGNDAPFASTTDTYVLNTPFNGVPLSSVDARKNNPDLLPERTKSLEAGVELKFLRNKLGLDLSVYKSNTFDQIIPVTVSSATGNTSKFVNAGNIENKGIEASLNITPVRSKDFTWNVGINWAKNANKVIELFEDQTNLQLASFQGGISVNATVGEPFGAIWGTNFVYHTDGSPIVSDHPRRSGVAYVETSTPETIGNINPDWKGGVMNSLTYKDVSLSFLIDIQQGGNFFSLDTWYGFGTGIYDITAGTNSQGGDVRGDPDNGGGLFLDDGAVVQTGVDENGVPVSDGTKNTRAYWMGDFRSSLGWTVAPNAYHTYDASYAKLREVSLSYSLPQSVISKTPFTGLDISLIGRNLWILAKNSEYSDPEAGLSAGNIQGNQSGAYPAVREYGFNVRVKF